MTLDRWRLTALALLLYRLKRSRRLRPKRRWVKDRSGAGTPRGHYQRLAQELRLDSERFKAYYRLTVEQFDALLQRLRPHISRMETNYRSPVSPSQRLSTFLRYLATGMSYRSLANSHELGVSTVSGIVRQVSRAIWDQLVDDFMPAPTPAGWADIALDYRHLRNFPNCIGSVFGKNVAIKPTGKNYEQTLNIVLLAVVDARQRFRLVDVGSYNRAAGDGSILSNSMFGQALKNAQLNIPADRPIPGAEHLGPLPLVLAGDEAFPLTRNIMSPYKGKANLTPEHRAFNDRLSHGRKHAECAFDLLAKQFPIFHRAISKEPETAALVTKAACMLHNYTHWDREEDIPSSQGFNNNNDDGVFVYRYRALQAPPRLGGSKYTREARTIRDKFAEYFSTQLDTKKTVIVKEETSGNS